MPISTVLRGVHLGARPPRLTRSGSPSPSETASDMPWMLPDGVVSGVLASPWASNQISPSVSPWRAKWLLEPAIEPIAMLWSPPSTSGMRPSPRLRSTSLPQRVARGEDRRLVAELARADRWVSGIITSRSPKSSTLWPSASSRGSRSAMRMAEGPMSTPRRPAPRSSGTPMISICVSSCMERGSLAEDASP